MSVGRLNGATHCAQRGQAFFAVGGLFGFVTAFVLPFTGDGRNHPRTQDHDATC